MAKNLSSRCAIALLSLVVGAQVASAANEPTRTFPQNNCRYTLLNNRWEWVQSPNQEIIFTARSDNRFLINFACQRHPNPGPIDANFGPGFEKSFYASGKMTRRGGHLTIFKGQSCYQAEAALLSGETAVQRVFNAFGMTYLLTVIGGKEPIEKHPDFEKIFDGFEFTVVPPPDPVPNPAAGAGNPADPIAAISQAMGSIACILLIVAAIAVLVTRFAVKKKPKRRRFVDEDEDFEERPRRRRRPDDDDDFEEPPRRIRSE